MNISGEPPPGGEPPQAYCVAGKRHLFCCDRVCYMISKAQGIHHIKNI